MITQEWPKLGNYIAFKAEYFKAALFGKFIKEKFLIITIYHWEMRILSADAKYFKVLKFSIIDQ